MNKNLLYLLLISVFFCRCDKNSGVSKYSQAIGQGGSMARFTITGNYLYTVDNKQLKVFDISQSNNPVLKGAQDVGFNIETIFPFKDKLFIGSASQVYIYSLDNPAKPKLLSSAISPQVMRRCDPVVAMDSVAFATLRTNGPCGGTQSVLAVYNIKDITHPQQVFTYPLGEPYGLGYKDDVLYVCDKERGLLLFDISDPYKPELINSNINDGSYVDVIPYQNTLICWTTTGVILYDITNNHEPVLIKNIQ